jgi:hypothetical protein
VALAAPAACLAVPIPPGGAPATPPLTLPAPGDAAAAGAQWLVGARPGVATDRIAARFGAERLMDGTGIYAVRRGRARSFAAALRSSGRLTFAEPPRTRVIRTGTPAARPADAWRRVGAASLALPVDPLTPRQWWLRAVVRGPLTRPVVTPASPVLSVIDSQVDMTHPDVRGSGIFSATRRRATIEHGTAVSTVAGAPDNGVGIVGVWPGMRISSHATDDLTTPRIIRALDATIRERAAAVNMSYGGDESFAERIAQNRAFGSGVILVASAGNEFREGNPVEHPAADEHVLTVAAVGRTLRSSDFSSEGTGVDLSAPGQEVLLGVPRALDEDGRTDGYAELDGTSFSAPIVAAAVTWIRAARPELTTSQLFQLVRVSARDLGDRGWDQRFGFGLLDVRAALTAPAPSDDPLEPNDDIAWTTGRHLPVQAPVWRPGAPAAAFTARLDVVEDPADVYRIVVAPGATARVTVRPRVGDVDLQLFRASATSVFRATGLISTSQRGGTAAEAVTVRNTSPRPATYYAAAYIDERSKSLDAAYRLEAGTAG